MDPLEKNKILVLGRSTVDKDGLVQSIASPTLADGQSQQPVAANESSKVTWSMETRYYSAELEFWLDTTEPLPEPERRYMQGWLEAPDSHNSDNDDGDDVVTYDGESTAKNIVKPNTQHIPIDESMVKLQEHLSDVVDAVVFVFDPTDPSSFTDILPWARYGRLYQPGVLLCVAASGPIGNNQAPELPRSAGISGSGGSKDKWFAWCIRNGWEWVDLTDSDPDTEYTVGRVHEALTSNEWPNMVMKQHPRQTAGPPNHIVQNDNGEPDIAQTSNTSKSGESETRPLGKNEQEEWDLFDSISRSVDPGRVEALRRLLFATNGTEQVLSENSKPGSDDDTGDLAPLLDRLRRIRDEISHLDKDQARAKAAELAMAFANNS
ncbi:hypothetical protein IW140_000728 [Coemansia sp. RSA 1813]|nr:hypothetical protein EV178_000766 [Coemansia sp. RSA 1646]KAJ1773597.1 hypothetical protein LPJ74_000513 [Coemansia sp. RSA 1843]KAJ2092387.1 hypothetical protein IW138_001149 [Coemansia sp. RSA 986]KAJ2217388.1 hypothetical protein EV179_000538 [Coemansia sp. RSA 487]KAJ2572613.1 hypothetical protein IW140_000728 [Coemansia sp. RSA 1813]